MHLCPMTSTKKIRIGNLEFDCRVSGNEQNELIIFLHGFPETSFMWKKLMHEISSLGFYCLAPDMRGYSKNACPKGIKHYTIKKLSNDILSIADSVDKGQFHLIGHDWGAAIGWNIVYHNYDRIKSWTALSVPHTRAFGKAIKLNKEQQIKSRYIKWFLLPVLPEIMLRMNDFQKFRRLWKHSNSEELENYLSIFRRKYSLTAALNYYRANIGRIKNEPIGNIKTPTLFIWGKYDMAIGSFAAENNHKYMKGDYTFLALDAGHWLIQESYAEIEAAIVKHISQYRSSADQF
jgi:pimeloyl-ACP methyl ester carboxylesterase